MVFTLLSLVCFISCFLCACGGEESEDTAGTDTTETTAGTMVDSMNMAGAQAGIEAGTQAGIEAGTQAGTEAGTQAGTEAGTQAGTEAGTQAGTEAGTQAGTEAGNQAGTTMMSSDCDKYCTYLEECNSCLFDENGECLPQEECVRTCASEVPPVVAACVAPLASCDEASFLACYDNNIRDDDCAQTCRLLEECDQCFIDENNECLSLAGCALVCREQTPVDIAACIASQMTCDAIDVCYESSK